MFYEVAWGFLFQWGHPNKLLVIGDDILKHNMVNVHDALSVRYFVLCVFCFPPCIWCPVKYYEWEEVKQSH